MSNAKKGGGFFQLLLGGIMLLFIGILVYVYHESKLANPIMLDEKGHVRASDGSSQAH